MRNNDVGRSVGYARYVTVSLCHRALHEQEFSCPPNVCCAVMFRAGAATNALYTLVPGRAYVLNIAVYSREGERERDNEAIVYSAIITRLISITLTGF